MRLVKIIFFGFTLVPLCSQVEINLANSNTQSERVAVIRYLLDAFELNNPQIKVNLIPYDDNQSSEEIINRPQGAEPDIIMADSVLFRQLMEQKEIDWDLTSFLINRLDKGDFYGGTIEACQQSNRPFIIPYSAWLQVIWYRSDWLEEEGLPRPDTLSALKEVADSFAKDNNRYGVILGTENNIYTQQCFLHISGAYGLYCHGEQDDLHVERSVLEKSLKTYDQLMKTGPSEPHDWRARDYFFQNRAGLLFYSTHLMDDLALEEVALDSLTGANFNDLSGAVYDRDFLSKVGSVTTLKADKEASFGSISGIGIFKTDNERVKEAIEKLVLFLYEEDVYNTWLHMSPGGMLPVRKSTLKSDDFFRDPEGIFEKYGRSYIVDLIEGLERIRVVYPDCLTKESTGEEREFLSTIYTLIHNPQDRSRLLEEISWVN